MKMSCENASSLVPSYLDGELTEEQAAPLRSHLFDCRSCREVAKEEKAVKRWFAVAKSAPYEPRIPTGFSTRVARLALSGVDIESGSPWELEDREVLPAAPNGGKLPRRVKRRAAPILPFVLQLAAVAAVALFVLALALQRQVLPAGDGIQANPSAPPWEVDVDSDPRAVEGDSSAAPTVPSGVGEARTVDDE